MSLRRLIALIKKETIQIIKDPSALLVSFFLPLFLLFLYGYGVSLDLNHLKLGLLVEDSNQEATTLKESFQNSRYYELQVVTTREELSEKITLNEIRGFVVIPSYFSQYLNRPDCVAPIQIIADGSEPNTANFVKNYAKATLNNWIIQELIQRRLGATQTINAESRFWYNEELESRFFILPGCLAIIMTLIGTLLTALVIAREWERGTMEAIMSTSVKIYELILGKFIPYFCLGLLSMILCVGILIFFFGLPFRGSFTLLFLVTSAFLFSALGIGLLISTLARSQIVAYQIAVMAGFLPAYILSGFLFEISSMPAWIRAITYLLPARYLVQCLQTEFLVGDVPQLIVINILPMLGIGLIFFLLTIKKTVKRLD